MMGIFHRKRKSLIDAMVIGSPALEHELEKAVEKKHEADKNFHDVKSICGPFVIDVFLEALAKGKIKKVDHHG